MQPLYIEIFRDLNDCQRTILAKLDPRETDYTETLKRCNFKLSEPIYIYNEPRGHYQLGQGLPTNDGMEG